MDSTWSPVAARSYLFVSARDTAVARSAVAQWPEGPPDVCMTSPSPGARRVARLLCPTGTTVFDDPLLAGRSHGETEVDYAARTATALRLLNAIDSRSALVVWDQLPTPGDIPFVVAGDQLLPAADAIERKLPAPF